MIVTPELVRPIPEGQQAPDLKFPQTFLPNNTVASPLHHPEMGTTGPVPVTPPTSTVPLEQLEQQTLQGTPNAAPNPAARFLASSGACPTRDGACRAADGSRRAPAAPSAAGAEGSQK